MRLRGFGGGNGMGLVSRAAVVSSPHIHGARPVPWIMRQVVYALTPAFVTYVFLFGFGVLIQLGIAIVAALLFEAWALRLRGFEPRPFLEDGSAVVLACLLTLAIPPYAPWWVTVAAVGFAILAAKHAFGGLGHNIFNPAMVGYMFVLLCFPLTLSRWPDLALLIDYPGPWASIKAVFADPPGFLDGISGATALDHIKTQAALMRMLSEMRIDGPFGAMGGRGWEWINVAILAGGGWLLWRRVITWRLPLSYLGGLAAAALVGYVADPELHRGAVFHLFAGGAMLAAFFIVTDPVSSATTPKGMLIFGLGAGLLTYLIREFGSYPDGVAFSVVIMNAFAPLIDRITQPGVYGKTSKPDDPSSATLR
jgi:H+/Na+-translocating ferredoxin:NAD+ oxidoreductase subunit D